MPKKTTTRKPTGVSVKIPPSAKSRADRIAKREQRSLGVVIDRALVAYEGSSK